MTSPATPKESDQEPEDALSQRLSAEQQKEQGGAERRGESGEPSSSR